MVGDALGIGVGFRLVYVGKRVGETVGAFVGDVVGIGVDVEPMKNVKA